MPLTFTVEDMKTPAKLERVFQQVRTQLGTALSSAAQPPDLNQLASQLAPILRTALQATGTNPLNTGSLLPNITNNVLPGGGGVTINTGTGLSGGGLVALGGSLTLANTGVTSNVAGTGISVSGATGAVTITNSGVTSIVAGTGISISGATGAVTITATTGGVTSITGTPNQVNASASTGAITLSLPQSIATSSNVQFGSIGVGVAASGTAGRLTVNENLIVSGVGPHVIGGSALANAQLYIAGSFPASTPVGIYQATTLQPLAGTSSYGFYMNTVFAKAGSGTHSVLAGLEIGLSFTAGASSVTDAVGIDSAAFTAPATTTNATAIRIAAPTGATNNYAINVLSGTSVFAGNVGVGTTSIAPLFNTTSSQNLAISGSTGGALLLRNTSDTLKEVSLWNYAGGFYIDSTGAATAANNSIHFRVASANSTNSGSDVLILNSSGNITVNNKIASYSNVATVGLGVPAIYGSGRATGQTAANASVATYTNGAADGTFIVSVNILVTAFTAGTINTQVTYKDEGGTSRTAVFNFSSVTGTLGTAIGATGAFEGIPLHIRVQANAVITIATTVTVFTGTYSCEGYIRQLG